MKKNFKSRKYLVIGGAGFIGSNLVDKLIGDGKEVIIIDNLLGAGKENINKKAKFFELDASDLEIFNIFKNEKPDIIYYLAGPINLKRDENSGVEKILQGFRNSVKATVDLGSKFIFISSGGAVYSDLEKIPINEECATNPVSAYGKANLLLEKILIDSKVDFTILRLSNIYGPRQWKDGIIPSFIIKAQKNITVDISGDGNQTRDFLYIDDTITALIKAQEKGNNEVFNVGSSIETSINKLKEKIEQIAKLEIQTQYDNLSEKTLRNVLDCSKFKERFNWEPEFSLKEGLLKTIDYYGR